MNDAKPPGLMTALVIGFFFGLGFELARGLLEGFAIFMLSR